MRRLAIILSAAFASVTAVVLGQTPQAPVFRGGVTLVTVDVTVLDGDGKPVPGLTAGDFEVKLDGHVRPVRAVAYEEVALPAPATRAGTPTAEAVKEATNAAPPVEPRLFVVMLDDLSIAPSRGKEIFFSATRFVDALPASDVIGFTTSSGTATLNPTRNRPAIDAALRNATGAFIDPRDLPGPAVTISDALESTEGNESILEHVIEDDCFGGQVVSQAVMTSSLCATLVQKKVNAVGQLSRQTATRQLQAYLNVITAMKPAPGLKELVIISDGLGVTSRQQMLVFAPVARAAAAAGVQLSVLSQEPDLTDASQRGPSPYADSRMLTFGLETMTDMAGGSFYRVTGEPDRFFSAVALATSAVYHLGVEAPSDSTPGRDFTLVAHAKRSGLTVHANRVALAPAAPVVVPVDDQLKAAVAQGLPNYGVPMSVATVVRRGHTSTELNLGASVEVPASAPGPLTLLFGFVDAAGTIRTVRKWIEAPPDGGNYRIPLSLLMAPGSYRLRLGIADGNGHVGSIDIPVTAQLGHVGAFLASDVMTSWSDANGKPEFLALEEVPAAATALGTFLELYTVPDAPAPVDVRVQWSLIGSTGQPAAEQSVVPVQTADRLTAVGQFGLEALPPGSYKIRATVLVAGRPVGAVSTTIRKAENGGR